jgi:hypothetical protein
MRRTFRAATGAAFVAAASLSLTTVAVADLPGGDNDDDGFTVGVEVVFSGDGAPGGGGSYTVHMPPICWWEQMPSGNVDPTDPEAVYEYYMEEIRGGGRTPREVLQWPNEEVFLDAIEREENGENITWYWISHRSANRAPCAEERNYGDSWNTTIIIYSPFADGEPPEPVVDPEVLAEAARERMVIDEPEVDRNPKMAGSDAGATLVNVPTWFWVTNPDSLGGADGERSIRAEVVGGDVWAEVTARTGGLSIASPAGGNYCEPSVALTAWGDGASDADACTVSFSRASVDYPDGYPVTASTEWTATWEGQIGDDDMVGGDLDPLSRETSVTVPVAEIQSIVRGAR